MTYALVTGAAKRIGKAVALHLSRSGYDIILHYNNSEKEAVTTADEIKSLGGKCIPCKADLSTIAGINALQSICGLYEITLAINNASHFKNDNLYSADLDDSMNEHFAVNFISKSQIIKTISRQNLEKVDIINLMDYGVVKTPSTFFSYHLSNKFLKEWTEMYARQVSSNIRINSIALGYTMRNDTQSCFEEVIETYPLRCSSTVDEICRTIDFITSVKSMTGQTIFLDGGMRLTDDKYR